MDNKIFKCLVDNSEFTTLRGLCNRLRKLGIKSKEYYDMFLKEENEDVCRFDGCNKVVSFKGISDGYGKYCSDIHACKSEEHRKSVRDRFVNDPQKLESFKLNIRKTLNQKTQTYWVSLLEKREKTILNRYGNNFHSEKTKLQWSKKDEFERKAISEKIMKTKEKSSWYKSYNFFGKEIKVQGYEWFVLDILINDFNFNNNDIKVGISNVPSFIYGNSTYYPDIYLPHLHLIIEVKSQYTLEKHYQNCIEKKMAVEKEGYIFLFAVFNRIRKTKQGVKFRKEELERFKKSLNWIISSQAPKVKNYGEGSTTMGIPVESSTLEMQSTL